MEQRTCNIIMCCKGHCTLPDSGYSPKEAIAAYMSRECGYPMKNYSGALIESILREALFDYISCADNPGFELRNLLAPSFSHDPSLSERICSMFQLTAIRGDAGYVNGFTEALIAQSKTDLGG